MPEKRLDYFTEEGARALAKRISNYWLEKGFALVLVEPTPLAIKGRYVGYGIKSNIGAGGPPT